MKYLQHEHYLKNKNKIIVRTRINREKNWRKYKERINLRNKNKRLEILNYYSNGAMRCMCPGCTISTLEFLTIDHINGGGNIHRRQIGNGNVYSWLKRKGFPTGFRVLCYNCNLALGHYGYCPHMRIEIING